MYCLSCSQLIYKYGYEKDILHFEGHIADIEEFIEVYERAYK